MRRAVYEAFVAFTERFEGATTWMYLDKLNYETTGYGNRLSTLAEALALPWRWPAGRLATRDEVTAEWALVGARTDLAQRGGGHFAAVTRLRLTEDAVQILVTGKLFANHTALCRRFSEFEGWCADAQLGIHSLTWACGGAFRFPILERALHELDFETAVREIYMSPESNPGNDLTARNAANRILMSNAARVHGFHLDPEELYYPTDLEAVARAQAQELETLPDLPEDEACEGDEGTTIIHPGIDFPPRKYEG